MKLLRRRRHDDHLAHMATKLAGWKHRAEVAEAKAERNEAVARLRDMAADRANRSAAS